MSGAVLPFRPRKRGKVVPLMAADAVDQALAEVVYLRGGRTHPEVRRECADARNGLGFVVNECGRLDVLDEVHALLARAGWPDVYWLEDDPAPLTPAS